MTERKYIAIDLKSFYASVECVERGLDPLGVNLVVADESRTEKTICLAVSPSLKAYGVSGRARLFEVNQKVREINFLRQNEAPGKRFSGKSFVDAELKADKSLELSYIAAMPRMALYMDYSNRIYNIYLRYFAPEDIHVYSVDEVFIEVTEYLNTYKMTPHELTMRIIRDVLRETGITATAGIGTNLYLCKVAMDIVAKHIPADKDGVRIAELDEMSYRKLLWGHRPLTDFWRVGHGIAKKLEERCIYTMGDIAKLSTYNEDVLYRLFGVNAELLIDHAWGWEPCTMEQIKAYRPRTNSLSSGQVLQCPYEYDKTRLIVREMADKLALDLAEKGLVTDQLVLNIGYDRENLSDERVRASYKGEVTFDCYGRMIPKHAHGTVNLEKHSSSCRAITEAVMELFERIADKKLLARRINVTANHIVREEEAAYEGKFEQLDLFCDSETEDQLRKKEEALKREKNMQQAMIKMKQRYGKNAVMRGMNYLEGGTAISRNGQIGGHRA